jgi:hypothetical protein
LFNGDLSQKVSRLDGLRIIREDKSLNNRLAIGTAKFIYVNTIGNTAYLQPRKGKRG